MSRMGMLPFRLNRPFSRLTLWTISTATLLVANMGSAAAATPTAAPTPTPTPPPSAIGNEAVIWITVSPAYMHTGTVVAASAPLAGCQGNTSGCSHIWVSRDGGYTWKRAAAQGWNGIHPVIAADNARHETIFGAANNGILRSDDYGNTWKIVGSGPGTPTPEPSYASDQAVAVGGSDYVLRGSQSQKVTGSGGVMGDASFGFAPTFPKGGSNAPALLGGTDPKSGLPAVESCDGKLTCSNMTLLNGAGPMAGAPNLYLSPNFQDDGTAFAQTASGIFRTSNGGKTFAPVAVGAAGATATSTPMVALAPNYNANGSSHTAYTAILQAFGSGKDMKRSGGVYRSTDGGITWNPVGSGPLSDGALAVAVAPDGRLFASYITNKVQGGLLCSTDGSTWLAFCPAVGDVNGPASVAHPGSSSVSANPANGGFAGSPQSSTATASSEDGASGATNTPSDLASAHSSSSRPWQVPLIIAFVLAVGAVIAAVLRRRLTRGET